jgi:hypothetical protein
MKPGISAVALREACTAQSLKKIDKQLTPENIRMKWLALCSRREKVTLPVQRVKK